METKAKRGSSWQVIAAKRYRRMYFIGGDGDLECWVVMTKCPHAQTRRWRYALCSMEAEALDLLAKWNANRCGYTCQGWTEHSIWRIKAE